MNARPVASVALLALVVSMSGCFAPPAPEETAPAFSSEEEAFAAAEETYRAYVDALNQVDLSDPETFEPVFALTTGDANANARATLSERHANRWTVGGSSQVLVVEPLRADDGPSAVVLAICLDVSAVTLVDAAGASVVSADRPDVQSMSVSIEATPDDPGWRIAEFAGRDGEPECA